MPENQKASTTVDAGYFSHVPSKLYGLFDLMYRRACVEHNVILNQGHLINHHIRFNLVRALTLYQKKGRRNQVNRMIDSWSNSIQGLGKKFPSKAMLDAPLPRVDEE